MEKAQVRFLLDKHGKDKLVSILMDPGHHTGASLQEEELDDIDFDFTNEFVVRKYTMRFYNKDRTKKTFEDSKIISYFAFNRIACMVFKE